MLLSKITCPSCGATFVAADAHVTVPRFPRRWWHLSGERSEYRCPKCKAFCVMRVHPVAVGAVFVVIAVAVAAVLAGYLERRVAIAVGGTGVVMLLRFGARARVG